MISNSMLRRLDHEAFVRAMQPDLTIYLGKGQFIGEDFYKRLGLGRSLPGSKWHGNDSVYDFDNLVSMAEELWTKNDLDRKWGFV